MLPISDIRRALRQARRAIPPAERTQFDARIVQHLTASGLLRSPRHVASYLSQDGEPDLSGLHLRLLSRRQSLYLPRLTRNGRLHFVRWRVDQPMIVNRFGIPEPDRNAKRLPSRLLSVVLLPLVGFDSDGNRLGMGGGFYDRTFGYAIHSSARRPRLIGVAYECQRSADGLPRRPWDVPLDGVVTEAGLRLITRAGKQ